MTADPPQDDLLAATAAHLNWPWGLDRANALIVRLRDRIVEQAERDNKQCALLQAYARNDCEQDETIAALRAQLAERDKRIALMEEYIDRPCDPHPGDAL